MSADQNVIKGHMQDLPVINEGEVQRSCEAIVRAEQHPSMFIGTTKDAIKYVTLMVDETEKFIKATPGINRVSVSFLNNKYRAADTILEIQYNQMWQNGMSSVYSEHVMRIGDDQYEVFGSEKSAARMKAAWK